MTFNWSDLHSNIAPSNAHDLLCWTRMQAEAGQTLQQIVARKELERKCGDGIFLWGVGNAPSVAVRALARAHVSIPVIFSVMKSRPKPEDADAKDIFAWLGLVDQSGVERSVPPHSIVLSRARTATGLKKNHYALVCQSGCTLEVGDDEEFDVASYRNVGGRGAPVGASQVTALLKRAPKDGASSKTPYRVAMRAQLTGSYWVKLTRPVALTQQLASEVATIASAGATAQDWAELANKVRCLDKATEQDAQLLF